MLGADRRLVAAELLHGPDLHASNTLDAPDRVAPVPFAGVRIDGEQLRATLPPAAWAVLVTESPRA